MQRIRWSCFRLTPSYAIPHAKPNCLQNKPKHNSPNRLSYRFDVLNLANRERNEEESMLNRIARMYRERAVTIDDFIALHTMGTRMAIAEAFT